MDRAHAPHPDLASPLAGVRVLDLSRVLAGPYCTMLLGDLGADVIKVERPDGGDITRAWGPPFVGGESAYYLSCNRNKRSIAVDFSTQAGVKLVRRLAAQADVVVENFRPGQLARLGLGWDLLQAQNPALIGCSISGYGASGPDQDLGGYDVVLQGASGLMSITGEPCGAPMKVGVAVVDLLTAQFAANAILAALFARQQRAVATPRAKKTSAQAAVQGPIIDLALMDCALAGLVNVGQSALVTGRTPTRHGNAHPNIVPYQLFVARDGEYLIVALGSDAQWKPLCKVLGAPKLASDPAFQTNALRVKNRAVLLRDLDRLFRAQPAATWLAALRAVHIPCGPVNRVDTALRQPQVLARGMIQSAEHPGIPDLRLIANPIRWRGADGAAPLAPQVRRHPPRLNEQQAEIVRELATLERHTGRRATIE